MANYPFLASYRHLKSAADTAASMDIADARVADLALNRASITYRLLPAVFSRGQTGFA